MSQDARAVDLGWTHGLGHWDSSAAPYGEVRFRGIMFRHLAGRWMAKGLLAFCVLPAPGETVGRCTQKSCQSSYLWLVGNGGMVVMVLIIVPIPPFPTNQR